MRDFRPVRRDREPDSLIRVVTAFRLLLKVRVSRVPAASTAALASLAGPSVELFVTAGTLFSPVVKSATSLVLEVPRASLPASDRS